MFLHQKEAYEMVRANIEKIFFPSDKGHPKGQHSVWMQFIVMPRTNAAAKKKLRE